jgi:hypothetical protein
MAAMNPHSSALRRRCDAAATVSKRLAFFQHCVPRFRTNLYFLLKSFDRWLSSTCADGRDPSRSICYVLVADRASYSREVS